MYIMFGRVNLEALMITCINFSRGECYNSRKMRIDHPILYINRFNSIQNFKFDLTCKFIAKYFIFFIVLSMKLRSRSIIA